MPTGPRQDPPAHGARRIPVPGFGARPRDSSPGETKSPRNDTSLLASRTSTRCTHVHSIEHGRGTARGPRRGPPARRRHGPDEAPALSRHRRRPRRLLLRRRHLDGAREGRQRHEAHRPPGPRALPEVLAGREVDRLHRPVRGRRAGLRRPGRGRRAPPAHLLPGARALRPAPRLRQPGHGLDARRRGDPVPLAARRGRRALGGPPLHGPAEGRAREGPAHADLGRRPTSRPTASASPTRPSSATSAPGSATRAAGRRTSTSTTSPRNDAKPFAVTSVRTERDPMWIGNAVYFASDRDGTLNLYSYDLATEAVTKLTSSTTWDVRWPSSDDASRIVYELDGELHVFDVAHEGRPGALDLRPERRRREAALAVLGREERRGLRPQPEGRAGGGRGPRRRLHGADREGPHPEPHQQLERPRQVGAVVAGRQADRVPLRPQRRGRGLARRPGRREAGAGDERRPGDALRARSGRRREPTSPSPTRTASSTS